MIRLRWFLTGALTMCVVAAAIFILGARGFSARERPNRLESWFARRARSAAVPRDARALANPVPNTPEVQAAARAHWADHCALCHANDGSGETMMGKRTYPPAPDMRLAPTQPVRASPQVIPLSRHRRTAKIPRACPIHPRCADGHIGAYSACAAG